MFCPQCGISQSDDMKFCKKCGANLEAVRQAVAIRGAAAGERFDWGQTWVAEMLLSGGEQVRRKQEIERQLGITPQIKRYNEIKAGVITSAVGVAVSIFLYFLMQGVILSGNVPPGETEILRRVWVAGVIPFCVGVGLMINGIVVSKRMIETTRREAAAAAARDDAEAATPRNFQRATDPMRLDSADSFTPAACDFSVTEEATKHLSGSAQNR